MIMKKILLGLAILLILSPSKIHAQSGFFYGVNTASGNVWTAAGLGVIDGLLSAISGFSTSTKYIYQINVFKDAGEQIPLYYGKIAGFKADDLFQNIKVGAKIGWMGSYSPIGIYANFDYGHDRFETRLAYDSNLLKHRVHSFKAGIGVRFSPATLFDCSWNILPLLEVGTNYNWPFKYKGGYNDDITQLNKGTSMLISLGAESYDSEVSILLGCEIPNYDFFNKNYTSDGGYSFPYANVSFKTYNIYLQVNIGF